MVAPNSTMSPLSTNGRNASCCALLKRWTSSTKSTVRRPVLARSRLAPSITARASLTPESTAEKVTNSASQALASTRASVVLPLPGGPQKTREGSSPRATSCRSTPPCPTRRLLPHDLIEGARPHTLRQRGPGREPARSSPKGNLPLKSRPPSRSPKARCRPTAPRVSTLSRACQRSSPEQKTPCLRNDRYRRPCERLRAGLGEPLAPWRQRGHALDAGHERQAPRRARRGPGAVLAPRGPADPAGARGRGPAPPGSAGRRQGAQAPPWRPAAAAARRAGSARGPDAARRPLSAPRGVSRIDCASSRQDRLPSRPRISPRRLSAAPTATNSARRKGSVQSPCVDCRVGHGIWRSLPSSPARRRLGALTRSSPEYAWAGERLG